MSPDEWVAIFAARDEAWRAARAAYHHDLGARITAELHPVPTRAAVPVVLPGVPVGDEVAAAPRRALDLAHSLGWAARIVASCAIDPVKGLTSVVTVRFRRHDERGYVAWWNGRFEGGWYVGPDGLEPLAGTRMRSRKAPPVGTMIRGYQDVLEGVRFVPDASIG